MSLTTSSVDWIDAIDINALEIDPYPLILGERERDRFSVCRFRDGRLVAVESVNRARDHIGARRILDDSRQFTVVQARRPGFDLNEFAVADLCKST